MELLASLGLLRADLILADAVYEALTIEQEQDEVLESQLTSAGEVLRVLAVGIDEGGAIELAGCFLYNFQARVC